SELQESAERCPAEGTAHRRPGWLAQFPGRGGRDFRRQEDVGRKAKAYTANAFSVDELALSTARLYTFVQPGQSLFGLNHSNPFDPKFLAPPREHGSDGGRQKIAGGIITFGGGVSLYRGTEVIGGLGVSGDTACADHEIAKKARDLAT